MTYDDDVQGLFAQRCTTCHHAGSPIQVDIQNPYNPGTGLVYADNTWVDDHPEAGLPLKNVVPGDPTSSFLMDKITGELPEDGAGGSVMPYQIDPLTDQELADVAQWITDGAQDNAFFTERVKPIFGSEEDGNLFFNGKCVFCHYEGSGSPGLDLTNPFGPNGLINVPATFRGDYLRVVPGNPDESFLMLKVRAKQPDSEIGASMPYSFSLLTERQIDIVRQWIVEGARP